MPISTDKLWVRTVRIVALVLGVIPSAYAASDIEQSMSFVVPIFGDEYNEGLEDYVDYDPTESLALLLSPVVVPNAPPESYRAMRISRRGSFHPPQIRRWGKFISYETVAEVITEAAREYRLQRALIDAVIRTESAYRPYARSDSGALGLMQLMPKTAESLGVTDPFDPEQNIRAGARYLRMQIDRFGDIHTALAAYNAGPATVIRYRGIPPFAETRRYVAAVMRRFRNSALRR